MKKLSIVLSLSCSLAVTLFSANLLLSDDQPAATTTPDPSVALTIAHDVSDLPVWTKDGKSFDPSILISLYKEKLPDAAEGRIKIAKYPSSASLIVRGHRDDHKVLENLLTSLRTVE